MGSVCVSVCVQCTGEKLDSFMTQELWFIERPKLCTKGWVRNFTFSHRQYMDEFQLISILLFEEHAVLRNIGSEGAFMFH